MAIDQEETQNSLFGNIKKQVKPAEKIKEQTHFETNELEDLSPKWSTFDRISVLLTEKQKDGLNNLARRLMKFRVKETRGNPTKERITANTLIRVLVDNFLEKEAELPLEIICSEEELKLWTGKLLK